MHTATLKDYSYNVFTSYIEYTPYSLKLLRTKIFVDLMVFEAPMQKDFVLENLYVAICMEGN